MKTNLLFVMMLLSVACTKVPNQKPVNLSSSDTLTFQNTSLLFETAGTTWKATLYTPVQPLALKTSYTKGRMQVEVPMPYSGIIEGRAQIELTAGNQRYYYPVVLRNTEQEGVVSRDYRSPKTVNPDSSLAQQQIIHSIDRYRNLVSLTPPNQFFREEEVMLAPRVGIFRADPAQPLSAYYVEPGSCESVPVRVVYRKEVDGFEVKVGPLQDAFRNTVADGTLVVFTLSSGERMWHLEEVLLNGTATRLLPASQFRGFDLQAQVDDLFSDSVKLTI